MGRPTDHPRGIAGWSVQHLGGPYMMWSEMTLEQQYRDVSFIFSQQQKSVRLIFQILQSIGNLTGGSAAMLPCHASYISKYMIRVFETQPRSS